MTAARRTATRVLLLAASACGAALPSACTTIDPGAPYVVPPQDFNANYFYCFVEPKLIFGKKCGDNGTHGCHFSDKVPGMELQDHPPVTCANGIPTDQTQVGEGSPASGNLSAVSIEMDRDYLNAPLYLWPTQLVAAHPIQVFKPTDPVVMYIATWATE